MTALEEAKRLHDRVQRVRYEVLEGAAVALRDAAGVGDSVQRLALADRLDAAVGGTAAQARTAMAAAVRWCAETVVAAAGTEEKRADELRRRVRAQVARGRISQAVVALKEVAFLLREFEVGHRGQRLALADRLDDAVAGTAAEKRAILGVAGRWCDAALLAARREARP